MQKKPSNTREQCAFDRGASLARVVKSGVATRSEKQLAERADNPHKKGSQEHQFWNEGFDSAQ